MKTYEIKLNSKTGKREIHYFINDVLDVIEFYNETVEIRYGYTLKA